jgi:hypothetical protein
MSGTYDLAKPYIITLRKTLDPQSQTYRESDQRNWRDNKLWEVTSNNIRSMAIYCLSAECTEDNLVIMNTKIRVRVYEKDFVNNIVKNCQLK